MTQKEVKKKLEDHNIFGVNIKELQKYTFKNTFNNINDVIIITTSKGVHRIMFEYKNGEYDFQTFALEDLIEEN